MAINGLKSELTICLKSLLIFITWWKNWLVLDINFYNIKLLKEDWIKFFFFSFPGSTEAWTPYDVDAYNKFRSNEESLDRKQT